MKLACLSFTDKGAILGERLSNIFSTNYIIEHYPNSKVEGGIKSFLYESWSKYDGFIFISATGIASRMISPYVKNKTMDPAIIVVDDIGKFSISLLSGHLGGANEVAQWIGERIGAIPVITTASDNRGIDSIDIFAKRNNYYMEDMDSVTRITSMMVNDRRIGLYSEDVYDINLSFEETACSSNTLLQPGGGFILPSYNNIELVNDLEHIDESLDGIIIVSSKDDIGHISIPYTILRPRNINIGIGCRKGVDSEQIIDAIKDSLKDNNLSTKSISTFGTVEVKKHEVGIIRAAEHFKCPLKIFTLGEIVSIQDMFEKSQFVKDTIGVYSVSEPCAYLLGGELITRKSRYNGVTISISKKKAVKEKNMKKLYVVGIGPGGRENMTLKAVDIIKKSDVIIGYTPYIEYLGDLVEGKELFSTGMKGEIERCKVAIEMVRKGKTAAIISTGDAGLYGMAGPILELAEDVDVEIIPGVTAAFSASAELGSPIMHDYASISLSDLLTPWEIIENRLVKAAEADFVITIYNPKSKGRKDHLKRAIELILIHRDGKTPVGIVKNSGRPNTEILITTLNEIDYDSVDMLCVLIIGNSNTYIKDNKIITPRGYNIK